MRISNWISSIVPRADDRDVYLVVDDLGRLGRLWREADYEATDLETVLSDLFTSQYNGDDHVVSFNTAEGWSRDVSPTSPPSCAGAATCSWPNRRHA